MIRFGTFNINDILTHKCSVQGTSPFVLFLYQPYLCTCYLSKSPWDLLAGFVNKISWVATLIIAWHYIYCQLHEFCYIVEELILDKDPIRKSILSIRLGLNFDQAGTQLRLGRNQQCHDTCPMLSEEEWVVSMSHDKRLKHAWMFVPSSLGASNFRITWFFVHKFHIGFDLFLFVKFKLPNFLMVNFCVLRPWKDVGCIT